MLPVNDKKIEFATQLLKARLREHGINTSFEQDKVIFDYQHKSLLFFLAGEHHDFSVPGQVPLLAMDYLVKSPAKIVGMVLSKLKRNSTIFARNCEVKKIEKERAEKFAETYHLLNATQSAYNLGLFYKNELVAIASFSKGRKMNRLPEGKRSFELIRFCCKSGVTIAGGLTRLLRHFCLDKEAGDVMTYIDKQFSDGKSFAKAGFKKFGETPPNYFLVDKITFDRTALKDPEQPFDEKQFYLIRNLGNIKMIFNP